MGTGFEGASLAIFTGLTPSGAVAFLCLAVYLLFVRDLDERTRRRLSHALALPLAVAWAGLVAAATHLGTPANALYAFSAVGESPLSTEVACVVAFLIAAGVRWLYGFAVKPHRAIDVALLALGCVCACALLAFTSTAYAVSTVPSWDTWLVPVCIVLGSACAGPSVAALALAMATSRSSALASSRHFRKALLAASGLMLVASTAMLLAYSGFLASLGNNVLAVGSMEGLYDSAIAAHAVLTALGLGVQVLSARVNDSLRRKLALGAAGCLIVLVSAVIVRLPFYEAYLSVGF